MWCVSEQADNLRSPRYDLVRSAPQGRGLCIACVAWEGPGVAWELRLGVVFWRLMMTLAECCFKAKAKPRWQRAESLL